MKPALEWHPAPGKLNLFLHVLGRRDDGMHLLQTVFRLVEAADRVGAAPRADGEIRFSGDYGEDNLVLRAARLLKAESGTTLGADLALEKHLPVGGGVGGGSSDAATTLLVLNRLWRLKYSRARLMDLALRLGADVPLFVFGECALGGGVGERLTRLELPPAWYLVLVPQVPVSTKEIFSDPALTRDRKPLKIPPFLSGQGCNDLEPVAVRRNPGIAQCLAWLRQHADGASIPARMTGSGSCVFAEFERQQDAIDVHGRLPGTIRGFVTRGLQRHPLHDWI